MITQYCRVIHSKKIDVLTFPKKKKSTFQIQIWTFKVSSSWLSRDLEREKEEEESEERDGRRRRRRRSGDGCKRVARYDSEVAEEKL